jgi:hypothetical protein
MHQDYIYPQMTEYLTLGLQHVHHHVPVLEADERYGCIAMDLQVQVIGPRPPLAHFHLQTRPPLHQQHIHPRWPPPL